jgi:drug/metabolite transporter (DMT)-like permease
MLWSSVFPLGKEVLTTTTPLFLTSSRMIFAGLLLLFFLFLTKIRSFKLSLKQFFLIALLGIFNIYLVNALEFWSLQHLSASKVCFLYGLSPFLSAFLSFIHFGEKMTRKKWYGLGFGFLAYLPVLFLQQGGIRAFTSSSFLPELAMIGAVFFSCYGWILLRYLLRSQNISFSMANGMSMLIGGVLALGHSLLVDTWSPYPVSNWALFAKGLLLMTFISNIICYNLYGYLLKKYTATLLSFAGLLSPIFASISAYFILNEPFEPIIFVCTAFILFALYIVYTEELRLGYIRGRHKKLSQDRI